MVAACMHVCIQDSLLLDCLPFWAGLFPLSHWLSPDIGLGGRNGGGEALSFFAFFILDTPFLFENGKEMEGSIEGTVTHICSRTHTDGVGWR